MGYGRVAILRVVYVIIVAMVRLHQLGSALFCLCALSLSLPLALRLALSLSVFVWVFPPLVALESCLIRHCYSCSLGHYVPGHCSPLFGAHVAELRV